MKPWILGGLACVGLSILVLVSASNSIIRNEQATIAAWGDVESSYQRRADLIPNLIKTVRAAGQFEERVFMEVTAARASVGSIKLDAADLNDPEKLAAFAKAQEGLKSAMSRLLAVAENYPQLKATEAYRDLMTQLEGTENRIQTERHKFNKAVQVYNTSLHVFPNTLVSGGYVDRQVFKSDAGADKVPSVEL